MDTEIIVVIIASIVSAIVGIANMNVTLKISKRQSEKDLKISKIGILEDRRKKIEIIKTKISTRNIDVGDVKQFEFEKHYPRIINFFQQNANDLISIGHLLNKDFVSELKTILGRIDGYIAKAKSNLPIDDEQAKIDLETMSKLNNKIMDELDLSLERIEDQIDLLLA